MTYNVFSGTLNPTQSQERDTALVVLAVHAVFSDNLITGVNKSCVSWLHM